jgi:ABC-type amino acid transport substrate-binding protein
MKWRLAFCATLTLAACDRLPMDPDGTLDRVRSERSFRVGLIATGNAPVNAGLERAFLGRVARATGARPTMVTGASEPLLLDLEDGGLDLVIGPLSSESPWVERVALIEPLGAAPGPHKAVVTPIARNGENRWISLLEREARGVAGGAR